jgi:hypothetical protein
MMTMMMMMAFEVSMVLADQAVEREASCRI